MFRSFPRSWWMIRQSFQTSFRMCRFPMGCSTVTIPPKQMVMNTENDDQPYFFEQPDFKQTHATCQAEADSTSMDKVSL